MAKKYQTLVDPEFIRDPITNAGIRSKRLPGEHPGFIEMKHRPALLIFVVILGPIIIGILIMVLFDLPKVFIQK